VLNYIDHPFVGPYFFLFMCAWGYLRHYLNLKVLYSIMTEFATVGPFELNWETEQYKCRLAQVITFSLLASLQAVNLYWWFLICRIAYRFVVTKEVDDDRSEYEESDAEDAGKEKKEKKENGKPKSNGSTNGIANGTPKLLVNGEVPSPLDEAAGSVGSRLKERKRNQK